MRYNFKVKFNDFSCQECDKPLFVKNIFKKLHSNYPLLFKNTPEEKFAEGIYINFVGKCDDCNQTYNIECVCHQLNNRVTVCVHQINKIN
jgi:hypothetical protein